MTQALIPVMGQLDNLLQALGSDAEAARYLGAVVAAAVPPAPIAHRAPDALRVAADAAATAAGNAGPNRASRPRRRGRWAGTATTSGSRR